MCCCNNTINISGNVICLLIPRSLHEASCHFTRRSVLRLCVSLFVLWLSVYISTSIYIPVFLLSRCLFPRVSVCTCMFIYECWRPVYSGSHRRNGEAAVAVGAAALTRPDRRCVEPPSSVLPASSVASSLGRWSFGRHPFLKQMSD